MREFAESDAFIVLETHRPPTLRPNFATVPSPKDAEEPGFVASRARVHESVFVRQISTTIQIAELPLGSEILSHGTSVSTRLLRDIRDVWQDSLFSSHLPRFRNCVAEVADSDYLYNQYTYELVRRMFLRNKLHSPP